MSTRFLQPRSVSIPSLIGPFLRAWRSVELVPRAAASIPFHLSLFFLGLLIVLGCQVSVSAEGGTSTVGDLTSSSDAVNFSNDVAPILTKFGCNSGACHAKSGGGQNGFELSLLGFEPNEDYRHLVFESRSRRLSPAAPEQSLIVLEITGSVPHGGGVRMDADSVHYNTMRDWIAQGAQSSPPDAPELVSFEVSPAHGILPLDSEQTLTAIARYSDDSQRDVTGLALFESNQPELVDVIGDGRVRSSGLPGKASVMVRYQGKVAVYTASIPQSSTVSEALVESEASEAHVVDRLVSANLRELGIPASPVSDDSTFLRRVTLDIAGRLPTLDETHAFLSNSEVGRRDEVIDRLLSSSGYADTFANKWTSLLKNRRDAASDITSNFAFHAWIRDSLLANRPYDEIVRELLAATGTVVENPAVAWYKRVKDPKEQIEDVAQLFLGVRMQCAQCHHHPFERWSQDDYYALAAFFTRIGRKPTATNGEDSIFHDRGIAEARNIRTGEMLRPAALGDSVGEIAAGEDPRLKLADWMANPENPFFAKALVNRYWKHFMGRGLIEPEDDLRDSNPPTNPELLAALEQHFIKSGFDLKSLVRLITTSQSYQRSALPQALNEIDRQNYSRYYPSRLSAEVMLDAIDQLAQTRTDFPNLPQGTRAVALPDNSYNNSSPFLKTFGRPEGASVCECERVQSATLSQSLHLLNAADIKSKLDSDTGRAALLAKAHFATPPVPIGEIVDEIYAAAFARSASDAELAVIVDYLGEGELNEAQLREDLKDVLWAVINSKEFLFKH